MRPTPTRATRHQNFLELHRKLSYLVAEPALSKRPKQREILPDLGSRGRAPTGHLLAGHGISTLALQILQNP